MVTSRRGALPRDGGVEPLEFFCMQKCRIVEDVASPVTSKYDQPTSESVHSVAPSEIWGYSLSIELRPLAAKQVKDVQTRGEPSRRSSAAPNK